jgi:hypothetical protein
MFLPPVGSKQAEGDPSETFIWKLRVNRANDEHQLIAWLLKEDVLRALDYFQSDGISYDPRMQDALDILTTKRRKDHTWPVQAKHPLALMHVFP